MKIELFVSEDFAPCRQAAQVWEAVCSERAATWRVIDIHTPEGEDYAARLGVRMVPMVVVNGVPLALGVQTLEEARALLASVDASSKGAPTE